MSRTVRFAGREVELVGPALQVGDPAPEFRVVDQSLAEKTLADLAADAKVLVLLSVPSLDTAVCNREVHRFNEEAVHLSEGVKVVAVSMDLPFAQKRWCGQEGVERVVTVSDHRTASFGEAYGVLIRDVRLLARAVFIVGPDRRLTYVNVLPDVGLEPNYEEVLQAARAALG